jgi:hypothetical protein
MSSMKNFLAFLAITLLAVSSASADYLEDLTTNQTALFEFGAYSQGNTWDFTSEGVAVTNPASTDNFGGMGVTPTEPVDLSMVSVIEVTARLEAGNTTDLTIAVREAGAPGEFYSCTIPQSSFSVGSFSTVTVPVDATNCFNGDVTDGVLNGMLDNTSIQTPFGSTTDSFFTVQSVNYVMVPEPGSLFMILMGLPLLALRRR